MERLCILVLVLAVYGHSLPVSVNNPVVKELTKLMTVLREENDVTVNRRNHGESHNGHAQDPVQREVPHERSGNAPTCSTVNGKKICLSNEAGEVSVQENCLFAHNKVRGFHGVLDLEWSSSLEADSRKWAEHLSDIGSMEHSAMEDYGENLFWTSQSFDSHATCGDAVYSWYSEVDIGPYNYNQDQNPGALHFTQLIWKKTTEVGCGISMSAGGMTDYYVVCRYKEKGNWMDEFIANIPQPSPPVVWDTPELDSVYDLEKAGACFNKYDGCDKNSCNGMFADFYKPYCSKQCTKGC